MGGGVTGTAVATLSRAHERGHCAWRSRPTARLVLTGSDDKTARLWDAAAGTAVATLAGHTGCVRAVAFSPDGAAGADRLRRQHGAAVGRGDRHGRSPPCRGHTNAVVERGVLARRRGWC